MGVRVRAASQIQFLVRAIWQLSPQQISVYGLLWMGLSVSSARRCHFIAMPCAKVKDEAVATVPAFCVHIPSLMMPLMSSQLTVVPPYTEIVAPRCTVLHGVQCSTVYSVQCSTVYSAPRCTVLHGVQCTVLHSVQCSTVYSAPRCTG